MDDLAVDSDEEVDYSKMDQVSAAPSMHQQNIAGEFILKEMTGSEAVFCFRGTKRARWAAGTLTLRRSTLIT